MRQRNFPVLFVILICSLAASAAKLRQIAVIDMPGRPGFDSIAFMGNQLVMAQKTTGTLAIFDPVKRRVVGSVAGLSAPRGLATDVNAFRVFVANSGNNTISVVDGRTWKITSNIQVDRKPENILYLSQSDTLYVTNPADSSISSLKADGHTPVNTINIEGHPEQLVYDSARNQIWVSLQNSNQVATIDPTTNSITHRYDLAASQPAGLAFDSAARRLYVAVRYAVLVLNADTGSEIARVPSPAGTDNLLLDAPSNTLYAVAGDGTINVIKTAGSQFTLEQEIKGDVRGHTVAFDPQKKIIYMPGGKEGRSKLAIYKRVDPLAAPGTTTPTTTQIVQKRP